jgi:hypothetical protein
MNSITLSRYDINIYNKKCTVTDIILQKIYTIKLHPDPYALYKIQPVSFDETFSNPYILEVYVPEENNKYFYISGIKTKSDFIFYLGYDKSKCVVRYDNFLDDLIKNDLKNNDLITIARIFYQDLLNISGRDKLFDLLNDDVTLIGQLIDSTSVNSILISFLAITNQHIALTPRSTQKILSDIGLKTNSVILDAFNTTSRDYIHNLISSSKLTKRTIVYIIQYHESEEIVIGVNMIINKNNIMLQKIFRSINMKLDNIDYDFDHNFDNENQFNDLTFLNDFIKLDTVDGINDLNFLNDFMIWLIKTYPYPELPILNNIKKLWPRLLKEFNSFKLLKNYQSYIL